MNSTLTGAVQRHHRDLLWKRNKVNPVQVIVTSGTVSALSWLYPAGFPHPHPHTQIIIKVR